MIQFHSCTFCSDCFWTRVHQVVVMGAGLCGETASQPSSVSGWSCWLVGPVLVNSCFLLSSDFFTWKQQRCVFCERFSETLKCLESFSLNRVPLLSGSDWILHVTVEQKKTVWKMGQLILPHEDKEVPVTWLELSSFLFLLHTQSCLLMSQTKAVFISTLRFMPSAVFLKSPVVPSSFHLFSSTVSTLKHQQERCLCLTVMSLVFLVIPSWTRVSERGVRSSYLNLGFSSPPCGRRSACTLTLI